MAISSCEALSLPTFSAVTALCKFRSWSLLRNQLTEKKLTERFKFQKKSFVREFGQPGVVVHVLLYRLEPHLRIVLRLASEEVNV
jgi:hypothetical protein